ncbi:MAG: hypothetical protein LRZ85_00305 [Alphaproteobacteria bacterium]|nr:hypothetical protein [Alphaproteobacteria bacterium]MCD8571193.1 hypothetical protein [Alphaproteobacteria bacterium]
MKTLKFIVALLPLMAASCLTDDAPERPKLPYTANYANEGFKMARLPITQLDPKEMAIYDSGDVSRIEPAAGQGFVRDDTYQQETVSSRAQLDKNKIPAGCNIKDRFDRTETIAYQWGRNRVGFTYDTSGTSFEGAFLRYRLKFQPHKTSKERCRYNASWQGLLGSSYNEFFLRENNTVWDDMKVLRLDAESRLDTLLQR